MNYKYIFVIFFFISTGCSTHIADKDKITSLNKIGFQNKGFTLVYNEELFKKKIISKKIDDRSLTIFQKNLKKGTTVRIKNILNNKTIIAKVGNKSKYPVFNNSVISNRISSEIDLDPNQPYVEIFEILNNSSFIAKKAKTFDEEKQVADKAPVDSISINDLNSEIKKNEQVKKYKFDYTIKIADFYFKNTALIMLDRIKKETPVNKIGIQSLSSTQYRVFLGPFYNINSLQKAFNDINVLEFENIEIIKNDKNN
tara:strand:- start:3700 stop:4464 length:765 start_codon:yes stop_codon:yes gene_type:complete